MRARKLFKIYERKRSSGNVDYLVDLGPVVLEELNVTTRHTELTALERLRPYGADLGDDVDFYIKHSKPPKGDIRIGGVDNRIQKVKPAVGLSTKYLDTAWKSFFVPFRDYFKDCPITQVTKNQCQKYVYNHEGWNSTTIATHI